MTKLAVMIVVCVLLLGTALFVYGGKIIPATTNAGNSTSNTISNAFQ